MLKKKSVLEEENSKIKKVKTGVITNIPIKKQGEKCRRAVRVT